LNSLYVGGIACFERNLNASLPERSLRENPVYIRANPHSKFLTRLVLISRQTSASGRMRLRKGKSKYDHISVSHFTRIYQKQNNYF